MLKSSYRKFITLLNLLIVAFVCSAATAQTQKQKNLILEQWLGIGTTGVPAASSALQIDSTTKGFVPPRMSEGQRDAMNSPLAGNIIFNTTTGQLNAWNGSSWGPLGGLAAMTPSRAVVTDGSGFVTTSSVTSTEVGYLAGLSSAIQTQIDAKMTNPMTTDGDLVTRSGGGPARIGIGTSGYILTSNGSSASWAAAPVGGITALTGDVSASGTGSQAATIALGAVATNRIANGAVTAPKIGTGEIGNTHINAAAGIGTTKLAALTASRPVVTDASGFIETPAATLPATMGGTGLASYTTGDQIVATGTNTLGVVGIGTTGQLWVSRGPGQTPVWSDALNISQASFYGGAIQEGGANCTFSQNTSSALNNWVDLGSAGSCAQAWTSQGNCTATGPTSSQITCSNMPPGNYRFEVTGYIFGSAVNASGLFRFSDGTNAFGITNTSSSTTLQGVVGNLAGTQEYLTSGTRTFKVQSADNGAGIITGLDNSTAGQKIVWTIHRFPLQSELAVRNEGNFDTTGMLIPYGAASCPAGTLDADGTAVSRTTYQTLFNRIGTTYGAGNGSTTFNLPNASGVFLRGTGTQTIGGVATPTITLGGVQGDTFQGHYHFGQYNTLITTQTFSAGAQSVVQQGSGSPSTNWAREAATDSTNGTPRTGGETRPANVGVKYCIVTNGQRPMPVLVGSVTSSGAGPERIERFHFGGASKNASCTTAPCGYLETSVPGAVINWAASGNYNLVIPAGTYSGPPVCSIWGVEGGVMQRICSAYGSSSTLVTLGCVDHANTGKNVFGGVVCMGPR